MINPAAFLIRINLPYIAPEKRRRPKALAAIAGEVTT
jgi:hypothetical protein